MGLVTIGWGFSKTDGVSLKRMGFQWGWLKINGVDFGWESYRG